MPWVTGSVIRRSRDRRRVGSAAASGAVIAFVGAEATGKSTLLGEAERSFGSSHEVLRIHVGKPPTTALTFVPHVLLPALRSLLPHQRFTRIEAQHAAAAGSGQREYPYPFTLRSVMLAYERRALLLRAFRAAAGGAIVLSDRFPSSGNAAPDGPQLGDLRTRSGIAPFQRWLAELEHRLYRDIPPPDLVIHLTAPLEVTVARNAVRGKREPEDHVRRRHRSSDALEFDDTPVHRVDTDRPVEETIRDVDRAIRRAFGWGT